MIKKTYVIPLKDKQTLLFIPVGDIHFDTDECDRPRFKRLVEWVQEKKKQGNLVRLVGLGDYLDFGSPSEQRKIVSADLHETTSKTLDKMMLAALAEFVSVVKPIGSDFLGLLSGHHRHWFGTQVPGKDWKGRNTDEWLSRVLGIDYLGAGLTFFRLRFPHALHLDVAANHGGGSAQTAGGRVMKRVRYSDVTPGAHITLSGHDNAKFVYPRSGIDFDNGMIKRYVVGTGSFQRAYLEGEEPGYAERMMLAPADLGVSVIKIEVEQRDGHWRVDYHVSV